MARDSTSAGLVQRFGRRGSIPSSSVIRRIDLEVQFDNGDIEEIDLDTWHELDLDKVSEPEGWSGSEDEEEGVDLDEEDEDEDDWDEDEDEDWDDDDDDEDDEYNDRN